MSSKSMRRRQDESRSESSASRTPSKSTRRAVLQINTLDGVRKSLAVDSETNAQQVLEMMADKIDLSTPETFALFEVRSDGDMVTATRIRPHEMILELALEWKKLRVEGMLDDIPHLLVQKYVFNGEEGDDRAAQLEFTQARSAVLSGELDCRPEEAVGLGAVSLVCDYGPFQDSVHTEGFLSGDVLSNYVPPRLLQVLDAKRLENLLLSVYKKLPVMKPIQCAREYVKKVSSWPLYGTTLFPARRGTYKERAATPVKKKTPQPSDMQELPKKLLIGVNRKGITLLQLDKNAVMSFDYSSVSSWAASRTCFAFIVGTDRIKYILDTEKGEEVSDLMQAYVREEANRLK